MAFYVSRICQGTLLRSNFCRPSAIFQCSRSATIQARPVSQPLAETHDEKNARLGRPQSPHLTIYKFQLTSMLSITHRFTGLALTAYAYGLGVASLATAQPLPELIQSLHTLNPTLILGAKALMAFPFAYHFCNGIRHLIWDAGKSLTIKGVYTSGYIMLTASSVLTIALLSL